MTIPKLSSRTLANGAKQFVVHEAALMMCSSPVNVLSLTLNTIVLTFPVAGALITTFFAPASRCQPAFTSSVNSPVHSKTTSTPSLAQGNAFGSFSLKIGMCFPANTKSLPS